jgi:hypothetical protein
MTLLQIVSIIKAMDFKVKTCTLLDYNQFFLISDLKFHSGKIDQK